MKTALSGLQARDAVATVSSLRDGVWIELGHGVLWRSVNRLLAVIEPHDGLSLTNTILRHDFRVQFPGHEAVSCMIGRTPFLSALGAQSHLVVGHVPRTPEGVAVMRDGCHDANKPAWCMPVGDTTLAAVARCQALSDYCVFACTRESAACRAWGFPVFDKTFQVVGMQCGVTVECPTSGISFFSAIAIAALLEAVTLISTEGIDTTNRLSSLIDDVKLVDDMYARLMHPLTNYMRLLQDMGRHEPASAEEVARPRTSTGSSGVAAVSGGCGGVVESPVSPPPPPDAALPRGWRIVADRSSADGRPYYWHVASGTTSWERPL